MKLGEIPTGLVARVFLVLQVPDYSATEGAAGGVLTNKVVSILRDTDAGEGPTGGVQANIPANASTAGGHSLRAPSPRAGTNERKPDESLVERAPLE